MSAGGNLYKLQQGRGTGTVPNTSWHPLMDPTTVTNAPAWVWAKVFLPIRRVTVLNNGTLLRDGYTAVPRYDEKITSYEGDDKGMQYSIVYFTLTATGESNQATDKEIKLDFNVTVDDSPPDQKTAWKVQYDETILRQRFDCVKPIPSGLPSDAQKNWQINENKMFAFLAGRQTQQTSIIAPQIQSTIYELTFSNKANPDATDPNKPAPTAPVKARLTVNSLQLAVDQQGTLQADSLGLAVNDEAKGTLKAFRVDFPNTVKSKGGSVELGPDGKFKKGMTIPGLLPGTSVAAEVVIVANDGTQSETQQLYLSAQQGPPPPDPTQQLGPGALAPKNAGPDGVIKLSAIWNKTSGQYTFNGSVEFDPKIVKTARITNSSSRYSTPTIDAYDTVWNVNTNGASFSIGTAPNQSIKPDYVLNSRKPDGTPFQTQSTQSALLPVEIGMDLELVPDPGTGKQPPNVETRIKVILIDNSGVPPDSTSPINPTPIGGNTNAVGDFRFLEQPAIRIPVVKTSTQPGTNVPGAPQVNPGYQPGQPNPLPPNPSNPNAPPTPNQPPINTPVWNPATGTWDTGTSQGPGGVPQPALGYTIQPPYTLRTTVNNNLGVSVTLSDVQYPSIWGRQSGTQPAALGQYKIDVSPQGVITGTVPDAAVTASAGSIQTDPSQQVKITLSAEYDYYQAGVPLAAGSNLVARKIPPTTFYLFFVDLVALQTPGTAGTGSLADQNAAAGAASAAVPSNFLGQGQSDDTLYTATQNPTAPEDLNANGNMVLKGPPQSEGGFWSLKTKEVSFSEVKFKVPQYAPSDAPDASIQSKVAAWYQRVADQQVVKVNTNWQTDEPAFKIDLSRVGDIAPGTFVSKPFKEWEPVPPDAFGYGNKWGEAEWYQAKDDKWYTNIVDRATIGPAAAMQRRVHQENKKREKAQQEREKQGNAKKQKLADLVEPRWGYMYNYGNEIPFQASQPSFNTQKAIAAVVIVPNKPSSVFLESFMPVSTAPNYTQSQSHETIAKRSKLFQSAFPRGIQ